MIISNKLMPRKKIEDKGIKYVLLSVVDHDNVIREIVESSDGELIGLQF